MSEAPAGFLPRSALGRAEREAHYRGPHPIPALDERERFVQATLTGALLASAAGAAGLLVAGRPAWAVAFIIGAGISLANFGLIANAVGSLDPAQPRAGWADLWKGALVRFGITGAVLVLAFVVFRVALLPLVAGLLLAQLWMVGHWLWMSLRDGKRATRQSGN